MAYRSSSISLRLIWPALPMVILISTYIVSEVGAGSGSRDVSVADLPVCRYGVAAVNDLDAAWVDDVGAGWYMNYSVGMPAASNGAEYVPLVWVQQDKAGDVYLPSYSTSPPITAEGLGALIDQYPGALWVVGNEVDRAPAPGSSPQGDTYPHIYAEAYHEIYHFIKNRDPAAQVANSGLVEITPGRLQYLDRMYDSYLAQFGVPMPVDVWNMHLYILPEIRIDGQPSAMASIATGTNAGLAILESYDPEGPLQPADLCHLDSVYCYAEHDDIGIFADQIVAMRTWMHKHGQGHKPLILSEFSQLYPHEDDGVTCWLQDEFGGCFDPERVLTFMDRSLDYLETARDSKLGYSLDSDRLVQQWMWFSISNTYPSLGENGKRTGYISDLVEKNSLGQRIGLTAAGHQYATRSAAISTTANLLLDEVSNQAVHSEGDGAADATLWASLANNGNVAVTDPFSVTFYADAGLQQVIGTVQLPSGEAKLPLPGCAREMESVSIAWNNLLPGVHHFWVKIDSDSDIPEDNETDNVKSGTVLVDAHEALLPVLRR